MKYALLCGALIFSMDAALHETEAKNYSQVICDDEPDADQCAKVQFWYRSARSNDRTSCCGIADAYWADQTDKITDKGLFVTITDRRDCQYIGENPKFEEDEDGNYTVPVPDGQACITGRVPRDGQQVFVPHDRLDARKQGNPTGHQVVFISAAGTSNYLDDGQMWPTVICAFPGFTG